MRGRGMRSRSGACAKLRMQQGRHFTARPPWMPAMPPIRVPALVPALVLALVLALSATPGFAASQDSRDDVLQATIAGEFALKAGKLDEAAAWYLQAADAASGDTGLAQRAAGVALVAGDEDRAAAALRLWRERDPGAPDLQAAEMTLALRTGDEASARKRLASLLALPGEEGWRRARDAMGSGRDPELAARLLGEAIDGDLIPDQLQAWLDFGLLALVEIDHLLGKERQHVMDDI